MTERYPNIELLDYIFQVEVLKRHAADKRYIPDTEAYVFPQVWPNTGGGFCEPGFMYGQALTTQYTTVLINKNDGVAMVSFGNKPAYFVDELTEKFMSDLRMHSMARKYDAHIYD